MRRDDIAAWLGTNRSRIADLRSEKLDRFSLDTLIHFATRIKLRVELGAPMTIGERSPARNPRADE